MQCWTQLLELCYRHSFLFIIEKEALVGGEPHRTAGSCGGGMSSTEGFCLVPHRGGGWRLSCVPRRYEMGCRTRGTMQSSVTAYFPV